MAVRAGVECVGSAADIRYRSQWATGGCRVTAGQQEGRRAALPSRCGPPAAAVGGRRHPVGSVRLQSARSTSVHCVAATLHAANRRRRLVHGRSHGTRHGRWKMRSIGELTLRMPSSLPLTSCCFILLQHINCCSRSSSLCHVIH